MADDLVTLMFGAWVPDVEDQPTPVGSPIVPVPVIDCLNVYFSNGNYISLPAPVTKGTAVPAKVLGAYTALDQEGAPHIYVGTQTNLYHWNGASWDDVSGGQSFFASSWSFAQFGASILAAFTPPQVSALSSFWFGSVGTRFQTMAIGGAGFSSPSGSASGSVVGVINQFAVEGDIWIPSANGFTTLGAGNGTTTVFSATLPQVPIAPFYVYSGSFPTSTGTLIAGVDDGAGHFSVGGMTGTINYVSGAISLTFTVAPPTGFTVQVYYLQSFPYRVQWSGIANEKSWPVPLTNAALAVQAGYEDLTAEFGQLQFIAGFPQFGIALQRFGITRMTYVGGSVVFTFSPFEKRHGAVSRTCVLPLGNTIYYVSDEGFYATDGSSAWSIGTSPDQSIGVDQWFKLNVNKAALSAISAGYDAALRCVVFAIPTGTNTQPDTLVIYNPMQQRWTKAAVPVELLWADNSGAAHQLGVFNQAHTYAGLTGSTLAGYIETGDIAFPDGMVRYNHNVRPLISCSDVPTAMLGVRDSQDQPVRYSRDTARDSFTKLCNIMNHGMLTRVRVSSAAATAITGAGIYSAKGGPF